jgi:hypothetical protein
MPTSISDTVTRVGIKPPFLVIVLRNSNREEVACGTYLKYMSNRPSPSYKRSPSSDSRASYTFEKNKKGYIHSISF